MVKINKVYTRSGDTGETGLVGGVRIAKDSPQVEAYGDIDELNTAIGKARTLAEGIPFDTISNKLEMIQNELFDLGSILATPAGEKWEGMLELDQTYIDRIESWIDQLNSGLPQLNSFVLPGGTLLNAELHLCRTKCRAVERKIVAYAREAEVNELIIAYINRLSDLLFVMARSESKRAGVEEYLWKPGGTRND